MAIGKWNLTENAIVSAEELTSAEIRVHLTKKFFEFNAINSAKKAFHRLGMDHTKNQNGVILYINIRRKKFAIFGGPSVHEKVGQDYWNKACETLKSDLKRLPLDQAFANCVLEMGKTLKKYFPLMENHANPNELSNEVTEDQ